MAPQAAACTLPQRAGYFILLQLIVCRQALFRKFLDWLMAAQSTRLYRQCAGRWRGLRNKKLAFEVQAPLHGRQASAFSQVLTGEQVDALLLGDDGPFLWTIILQVDGRPAGLLAFFRCPQACPYAGWWLSESCTRIRYRATAVEELLYRKAVDILARSRVRTLHISLPMGSPELRAWACRGFQKTPAGAARNNSAPAVAPGGPGRVILEAAIA